MMESLDEHYTIPKRLKYWANKQPDSQAFVYVAKDKPKAVLTSKEIYDLSVQFGRRLSKLGVEPGSVVCSLIPDSPAALVAYFGILCAGCAVQNATIQMSDGTYLLRNLHKSKCRAIILSSSPDDQANRIISQHFNTVSGNYVTSKQLPHLKSVIYTNLNHGTELGFIWQEGIELTDNFYIEDVTVSANDVVVIMQTSGTTGVSKLIPLDHTYIGSIEKGFKSLSESMLALSPPISLFDQHNISWVLGLPFWYTMSGDRTILLDRRFKSEDGLDIRFVRDIIVQEKCQIAKLSVASCLELTKLIQRESSDHVTWPLNTVLLGGQPLKTNICTVIGTLTNTIYNLYGSTEMGLVSIKKIDQESGFEDFHTGSLMEMVNVKIVDEDLKDVPTGTYGHVLVNKPGICRHYVGDEDDLMKSKFTDDGWYLTNDYGCFTEKGELIIQGRFDDVIMRGMNYFHPSWIENIIRGCPGVAEVLVVKVPDEALLNEICACYIPEKGSDTCPQDVKNFCRMTFVSHDSNYKTACPKYFLQMESFPLNKNCKYDRKLLEKKATNLLNLL
ncbi:medium-chain acyl-CoA ligase ACSF2, mitochondrial [Patella vulgata]|uniref:medium-chain acyl-CoA ligase ACSF2, mitochondrial n=1 Tax=Patella vulgata TaxID=6465 RepID=UPI00218050BF|nr:medium-chain acyl-CoA ligase ACSF2, mitochondrial [Patella vulgata]